MDFEIIKNTPYVFILLVASYLFNAILGIPTPLVMAITWFLEYYIVLWIYQTYAYKASELSWLDVCKRKAPLCALLFIGALIGNYIYYGTCTALTCICYAVLAIFVLGTLEHSLYN